MGKIVGTAAGDYQQGDARGGQRWQNAIHCAIAAKDQHYVWQVVGLKHVAEEDVDPSVAEGFYDVGLHVAVENRCGSHREIVQRRPHPYRRSSRNFSPPVQR
jgi:hypothetical protein